MEPILEHKLLATRRHLLGSMAGGIGAIAMHELLAATKAAPVPAVAADPMAAKQPPLPAKAKRMIVIHLTGSPPHLDMYDNKPELTKRDGQDCPAETIAGKNSHSPPARRSSWARGGSGRGAARAAWNSPTRSRSCIASPTSSAS